jgi:hypothetical protein
MKAVSFATLLVAVASLGGCESTTTSSSSVAPTPTEVVRLPFDLVVDPAVSEMDHERLVEFDAQFGGLIASTDDLPAAYREGYVRFSLLGGPGSTDVCREAVIPSGRSEVVTALVPLALVRVRAMRVPHTNLIGLRQTPDPTVLLLVDYLFPR